MEPIDSVAPVFQVMVCLSRANFLYQKLDYLNRKSQTRIIIKKMRWVCLSAVKIGTGIFWLEYYWCQMGIKQLRQLRDELCLIRFTFPFLI